MFSWLGKVRVKCQIQYNICRSYIWTHVYIHTILTQHTHIHIRTREHRRCSFRLQSERVQVLLGVCFLLSTVGWCTIGQIRIYQQCVDRNTGAYCHPQHPEELPESCRDLDYSQMGVPEAGLVLLSILRKRLTGNKRMPEKMDAVLMGRGTKTQGETYIPKCWCRFLQGESQ